MIDEFDAVVEQALAFLRGNGNLLHDEFMSTKFNIFKLISLNRKLIVNRDKHFSLLKAKILHHSSIIEFLVATNRLLLMNGLEGINVRKIG